MIRRSKRKVELGLTTMMAAVACAGLLSSRAWAVDPPNAPPVYTDAYSVNYYTTTAGGAPVDETVHIINPTGGTRCANIYVFDAIQNLQECCSCPITHNGLLTLSVNANLTNNPVALPAGTTALTNGVIKIVSGTQIPPPKTSPTAPPTCSAGTPLPAPELRAWIIHYPPPPALPAGTDGAFASARLDTQELDSWLEAPCATILSGTTSPLPGVCTCGAPGTSAG